MKSVLNKSCDVLKNNGVLLCPTDTIWGLSADATNFEAVEKVFAIKNRPANKSMIVLVADLEMLSHYVEEIPEIALNKLKASTTPASIIYPKGKNLAKNVIAENGSIAIRIVQNEFCKQLIKQFGKAIVSSSANISNETAPKTFADINMKIKTEVDYIIPTQYENSTTNSASSIYLIENNSLIQIR